MKVAALDLGTNTFLCLIAEVENSRVSRVYDDQVRVVRLGQGVDQTKLFHPDALKRAKVALTEFAELIAQHKPERVLAMATSAARDVENADELFSICQKLQIPVQIIPGSREAEITFRGAVSAFFDDRRRLIVDVGGGSTELIVGRGLTYEAGQSVDLGCVRLTEKYSFKPPVSDEKVSQVSAYMREHMVRVIKTLSGFAGGLDEILAVAGTPTELARIEIGEFVPEKIDQFVLTEQMLSSWARKFQIHTPEEIAAKFGVHPGRADVILVGTLLLLETLRAAGFSSMKVSTRGVRFGVALEMAEQ
jgi:exopolyphosphatase/guanosine-5'-triphosphate,3'-diphosphate pyrophosphatase